MSHFKARPNIWGGYAIAADFLAHSKYALGPQQQGVIAGWLWPSQCHPTPRKRSLQPRGQDTPTRGEVTPAQGTGHPTTGRGHTSPGDRTPHSGERSPQPRGHDTPAWEEVTPAQGTGHPSLGRGQLVTYLRDMKLYVLLRTALDLCINLLHRSLHVNDWLFSDTFTHTHTFIATAR